MHILKNTIKYPITKSSKFMVWYIYTCSYNVYCFWTKLMLLQWIWSCHLYILHFVSENHYNYELCKDVLENLINCCKKLRNPESSVCCSGFKKHWKKIPDWTQQKVTKFINIAVNKFNSVIKTNSATIRSPTKLLNDFHTRQHYVTFIWTWNALF